MYNTLVSSAVSPNLGPLDLWTDRGTADEPAAVRLLSTTCRGVISMGKWTPILENKGRTVDNIMRNMPSFDG